MILTSFASASGGLAPWNMSVLVAPGDTVLTVIPREPYSRRGDLHELLQRTLAGGVQGDARPWQVPC